MKPKLLTPIIAALASVGLAAGCGGDDDEVSGAASVAPADAPVYVDAVVRPEGEAADDAEAALGTLLGSDDPAQTATDLVESYAARDGVDLDYEEQIAPWLGKNFAVILTTIGTDDSGTDSEGVFVFETTDVDKARDFFDTELGGSETGEYEGVEYTFDDDVDDEGDVMGIIDDKVVGGEEAAFKAAVDASKGDSLADSDEFSDALGDLPEDRLASLYVPPKAFLDALPEGEIDAETRKQIEESAGDALDEPVLGDVTASGDAVTLELSAGGETVETSESALLESLPAQAWAGVGLADLGQSVQNSIDALDKADIQGVSAETVESMLESQTGINLQNDVVNALGDAAIFVQGTTEADVSGALVIESKDAAASAGLITKLQTLIRQQGRSAGVRVQPLASAGGDQGFRLVAPGELPQPIQVVLSGERIVAGFGQTATAQALDPGAQTLATNPEFTAAKDAVGELGIDAFLSLPTVLQIAETQGGLGGDASYRVAKPYLQKLGSVAIGSGAEDDRNLVRFVIGLTQAQSQPQP